MFYWSLDAPEVRLQGNNSDADIALEALPDDVDHLQTNRRSGRIKLGRRKFP